MRRKIDAPVKTISVCLVCVIIYLYLFGKSAATSPAKIAVHMGKFSRSFKRSGNDPMAVVLTSVPTGREFLIRVHPPARDSWLSVSLLNSGKVEETLVAALQNQLDALLQSTKGYVHVLDVGANIGFITLYSAAYDERIRVTAVEPTPWHFNLLEQSLTLNPNLHGRVKLFNVGLSKSSGGTLCMQVQDGNGAATRATPGECDGEGYNVGVSTVDEILQESWGTPPDVYKIDVEGFEGHVFDGSFLTLKGMNSKKNSLIISEYVPFRMKMANHDISAFDAFFLHFPEEDWKISVLDPTHYGLSKTASSRKVRQAIQTWNEFNHSGGDLLIRPALSTLRS